MTDFGWILASLKSRAGNVLLSVLLTAFGVMLAALMLIFAHHISERLSADGRGIDLVVGAKGSPLQLVLSSVYHIDMPTGNIPYKEAQRWMNHPHVRTAIPLALGDNWRGFRIAGTTHDYPAHYGAELAEGRLWDKPFEAVAGAATGLAMGAEFVGAHGLLPGGHAHDDEKYRIVGVLQPTGTVLDRLILTSLDSVLLLHGQKGVEHHHHDHHHHGHDHHHDHDHGHDHDHDHHHDHAHGHTHDHAHDHKHGAEPEITALLLVLRTRTALMNLPRMIAHETALQAANPAVEITRLTAMLGLGARTVTILSAILIAVAALSIFAGLAGHLDNRRDDLAVLRALGYGKFRIFRLILAEALAVALAGIALGIISACLVFSVMAENIAPLAASGAAAVFPPPLLWVAVAVLAAAVLAAALPALRAARIDVSRQLSGGF